MVVEVAMNNARSALASIAYARARALRQRVIKCRSLMLIHVFIACLMQGCIGPAPIPPSPTPNPHPQKTSQIKITVQDGSNVDNTEVYSIWTVGNIGCAPIHPVSGAAIVKQVEVKEKVEKVGSDFLATIVDDRFMVDKCKWESGGYEIHFMRNGYLVAVAGAMLNDFSMGKLDLACTPPPATPECYPKDRGAFIRSRYIGVFNATLEKVE